MFAAIRLLLQEGSTLLHIASANGNAQVVNLLLQRDANVNAQSFYRWTPLMQAAAYGHTAVISSLLENDASVGLVRKAPFPPLARSILCVIILAMGCRKPNGACRATCCAPPLPTRARSEL